MTSVYFRTARDEIKAGAKVDETLEKYNKIALSMGVSSLMSETEEEKLKAMEVKEMKKENKKTAIRGKHIKRVIIGNTIFERSYNKAWASLPGVERISKKAPKVSDCKVFKLYNDDSIDNKRCITVETFTIRNDGTAHFKVENEYIEWEIETTIENAREKYAQSLKRGYTKTEPKMAEAVEKTEVEPKKQTSKKSKKTDSKKTAKKTKKDSKAGAKESAKKTPTAKKASKKASKEAPKKETTKKETPKVFILEKWEGNKLTQYQFHIKEDTAKIHMTVSTMKISRGFVVADKNLECKTYNTNIKTARNLYKAMKAEGFVA